MASLPAFLVLPLQSTSALEPTRSFHLKLNHVILTSETYQLFSTAFKKESRLVLCGAHLFLHSTTSTSSHTVLHPTYTDTHTHTHSAQVLEERREPGAQTALNTSPGGLNQD